MRIKKNKVVFGIVTAVAVILFVLVFRTKERKEYIDTKSQHKTLNQHATKNDLLYNDSKTELEEGTDVWLSHVYRIMDIWKIGTLRDVKALFPENMKASKENLYSHMRDTWPKIPFIIRMTGNFQEENYNVMFFDVYIQEEDGYYQKTGDNIVMTIYEDGTFVPFMADAATGWEAESEEDIINRAWEVIN